jgi:hypothetical protein
MFQVEPDDYQIGKFYILYICMYMYTLFKKGLYMEQLILYLPSTFHKQDIFESSVCSPYEGPQIKF